jgi:poly-gamma-glutamate capsule biosynthesis protein CapA/YwtB (metallophosphatase superfamily)
VVVVSAVLAEVVLVVAEQVAPGKTILNMRMKNCFFLSGLVLISVSGYTQQSDPTTRAKSISLLFTGDIMGHGAQIASALDPSTGTYNYDSCFIFLKPYFDSADIAIGNLEVTLAGPPYSGYPQFSSPDGLAASLKKTGFDVLVNANNHAADRGNAGAQRTIRVLDSLGIIHTGTYKNNEQRDSLVPLVLEKNGFRIALLNYSYGINGLPMPSPALVSLIDTTRILMELDACKKNKSDFIIVEVHWGTEYQRFPNEEQKRLADFLLIHGADAIIGSHPHVIQPVEWRKTATGDTSIAHLVVWSMGNFISNQPERFRNGGIMVRMDLRKDLKTSVQVSYLPVFVYRRNDSGKRRFFLVPPSEWISGRLNFPIQIAEQGLLKQFYEDTLIHLQGIPLMDPH